MCNSETKSPRPWIGSIRASSAYTHTCHFPTTAFNVSAVTDTFRCILYLPPCPKNFMTSVSAFHQIHKSPPQPFYGPFSGPPRWAGARRQLLDFIVQEKINRGRHTDNLAGRHFIWTNQCPPLSSPIFYRPDALPAALPTVSKHWRQLVHSD